MTSAILRTLALQFAQLPNPEADLTGKVAIITGSNSGLGLETARHFVRLKAEKVILAVRSLKRGEVAKYDIEQSTNRYGAVEIWQLDLSSFESVQTFASRVQSLPRMDIVVENAAIKTMTFRIVEGYESTMTVNVLSTFLLALSLIPKLRETAQDFLVTPHLVILSSAVHFFTNFPESESPDIYVALNDKETSCIEVTASNTSRIVINAVDLGICRTNLTREFTGINLVAASILNTVIGRTAEVGSRTIVYAATSRVETHGKYLGSCRIQEPAPFVSSEKGREVQKRLWDQTLQKLERILPRLGTDL